jgi:glycosyltransferase involved in cell wall biosynthesis
MADSEAVSYFRIHIKYVSRCHPPPQPLSDQPRTAKVAVVLPVYNTARYLRECLDSLLAQTYQNFTVFAVNDGSSDDSGKILEEYAKKDSRIHVINKKNGGVSSARNVALDAIEKARSGFDLICFADSDDIVTTDFIQNYADLSVEHSADYVTCGWHQFDKKGFQLCKKTDHPIKVTDRDGAFRHAYMTGEWKGTHHWSFSYFLSNRCFGSKVVRGLRFDETMKKGEDQDYLVRALLAVEKAVICSRRTYLYRIRASSLSHDNTLLIDDMTLFSSLLKKTQGHPASAREGIELHTQDLWWNSLKIVFDAKAYGEHKQLFKDAYQTLKSHQYVTPLPMKFKRRFLLFALGDSFLRLYFSRKKTSRNTELDNAFE